MTGLATAHDYFEHVTHLAREQREQLRNEIEGIVSEMAAAGRLRSGATLRRIADATKSKLQSTVVQAFSVEKHAIKNIPFLDEDEIEVMTVRALKNHVDEIRALADDRLDRLEPRGTAARQQIATGMALDADLDRLVKSHRFGFASAAPMETTSSTVNNLHVGTAIGTAIQQGSLGATIHQQNQIDLSAVANAVATLDKELANLQERSDAVDELAADLQTVKAQLSKKSPAVSVLKQVGVSVRNIVEGAVGGALTPQVVAAATALSALLTG